MQNSFLHDVIIPWLWQLLKLSPEIILYTLGFLLALAYIRRATAASLLAATGTGICLLLVFVSTFLFRFIIYAREDGPGDLQMTFTILSVIYSFARAIAIGLLVAAAFVGRKRPTKVSGTPFSSG